LRPIRAARGRLRARLVVAADLESIVRLSCRERGVGEAELPRTVAAGGRLARRRRVRRSLQKLHKYNFYCKSLKYLLFASLVVL